MCGICGILAPEVRCKELEAMTAVQHHRGPDDRGVELLEGDTVGLGHNRLSIIDLSKAGHQPMSNAGGGLTIVFNGEVYNYLELKQELSGYPFRGDSDTEVVLAAYERWGGDCLEHFVGMFAFAIWDAEKKHLFCARDRMGVKPFHYAHHGGRFLFASEVKAFYGHPDFVARPDIDALAVRLAYEYPLDRTTLFEGVYQVAQGTIETWSLDRHGRAVLTGIARYSKDTVDPQQGQDLSRQSSLLLDSLRDSIEDRMMSDAPLGVVLSGGLDSSLIASLANDVADATSYEVPACWTVAGSEDNPDFVSAKMVAGHLDLEHHTSILPEDSFWKGLPNFVWHGEDLDVTVLFWQPLFEEMSSKVKVGLCGQGADELHGGYGRYRKLHDHSVMVSNRLKLIGGVDAAHFPKGPGQPWIDADLIPERHFSNLESTLQFELDRGQLSNFQLRLADRHSMAYGLEARVPFLASKHREISHRLPMNWRVSGHREKIALREAASKTSLPREIVSRPKLPAGTATAPSMVTEVVDEMGPHALEWAEDYGILAPMLRDQPDMALGIRLFHAMHFTEGRNSRVAMDLLTALEDVGQWPS